MGFTKEERRLHESITIDKASESSLDEDSAVIQELRKEEIDEVNRSDGAKKELLQCYSKIEALSYQNALNLSRLEEHVTKEEELTRKLKEHADMQDAIEAYKKENEELRKELKVKKKFVFRM